MKIPFANPLLGDEELNNVIDAIKSTWIGAIGNYIGTFEKDFSDYCGSKYASTMSNGTAALHAALLALDINPGDEVIVPDFTFIASANAASFIGAKVVLADVEHDTWNLDPNDVKRKITNKTKAIIPVHLYGHPCNMDPIMEIASSKGIFVVEDCAEAIGAEYKGKKVGTIGDIGCFSFHSSKVITTGEGGMCITRNTELKEKIDHLKNHAMDKKRRYWHDAVGYNYRMTNIQAAIGVAQLKKLDVIIKKKRWIAERYIHHLEGVGDLNLPVEKEWAKNVFWFFSVLSSKKDAIEATLTKKGIETRPFFYPLHELPPYKSSKSFPISTSLHRKGISLPSSVLLEEEHIKEVCRIIKSAV